MSTAKSMATLYLNGKRNTTNKSGTLTNTQRFKSSTSNLAQSSVRNNQTTANNCCNSTKSRLKSTSMTNLVAGNEQQQQLQQGGCGSEQPVAGGRMQRPMSRNALDSIHNGMNAKYAQVQSKVYLQNIKPTTTTTSSRIPGSKALAQQQQQPDGKQSTLSSSKIRGPNGAISSKTSANSNAANERSALVAKLKVLEDELANQEVERDNLRQELEREKSEKVEQVQQLKTELQDKLAEHDRQNEEYHKKLLEAYELADQNRRAADTVLSESRQRDEEARKKIDELEGQLNELKEFVDMKEEMKGKMFELREQIRQERERYEEQLKSLHQVFENEKIRLEEELKEAKNNSSNNNMLLHSSSGNVKLDENSNHYFQRMKPQLESSESINKLYTGTGCHKCQSGSSQLHKSEQDIYGSKMSTRMQDTAKSAWKASRKFASSVITGGVNLSACRQCTKRTGSTSPQPQATAAAAVASGVAKSEAHDRQQQVTGVGILNCASSAVESEQQQQQQHLDNHTSVIQVGPIPNLDETAAQTPPQRHRLADTRHQQSSPSTTSGGDHQINHEQHQQSTSLIRVDENNKLTIVTKFNDSDCQANGPEMGASSSVSERSRCESSSSGRGTSSDAGSAASQNGDNDDINNNNGNTKLQIQANNNNMEIVSESQKVKGHRRRSSLFKASKVFGGSQVSLHKLKSLFGGGSKGVCVVGGKQLVDENSNQQQQQVSLDHIEASRLRCLELNQAITVQSKHTEASATELLTTTKTEEVPKEEISHDNDATNNTELKDTTTTTTTTISDSQPIKIAAQVQ